MRIVSWQRPLCIGLSARIMHNSPKELGFRGKTLQYLEGSVAHWIMSQGALVFMVPTIEAGAAVRRSAVKVSDYVRELDGLVLQGGADVSPETYGESPARPEWAGDGIRDRYEIELLWEFIFQKKPVLGICRGEQLINVAFGGSLHQDIATEIEEAICHFDPGKYDQLVHDVRFESGSHLASLYAGIPSGRVTSIHHQAVKRLGNGLVVEARSATDGLVEAIRWNGPSYVLGVQWHPEFHEQVDEEILDCTPLLRDFLDAARATHDAGEHRPVVRASPTQKAQ